MLKTKASAKVLILTASAVMLLLSGCNTKGQNNNVNQQSAPFRQQQAHNTGYDDNRIQVASNAASNITNIAGVQSANVLVTRRNAYVATVMRNNGQLSQDIEQQIANQVRAADPNVQNVYVSTNPDLVDRFNGYVRDIQQGRPVTGFINQFNELVQRIFPNAK